MEDLEYVIVYYKLDSHSIFLYNMYNINMSCIRIDLLVGSLSPIMDINTLSLLDFYMNMLRIYNE